MNLQDWYVLLLRPMTQDTTVDAALRGCTVLLVEDESLVALVVEDLLQQLGCHVIDIVRRVEAALTAVTVNVFDVAILDANLNGETSYIVADVLELRNVPYIFATGYGRGIPVKYHRKPILQKPFTKQELRNSLLQALR
jgi:CheY-like chemotaxis protein